MKQANWSRILTILLVILASFALLYVTGTILLRFTQAILLFVLGAMLAYILTPLVNRLQSAFHLRWLAILLSYFFVAVGLFALAILLFTPFIQQSQSLVDNLRNPSSASLAPVARLQNDTGKLLNMVQSQSAQVSNSGKLSSAQVGTARTAFAMIGNEIYGLRHQKAKPAPPPVTGGKTPSKSGSSPVQQPPIPASYINSVETALVLASARYRQATQFPAAIDTTQFSSSVQATKQLHTSASDMYHTMSTTPILLLYAQDWLDSHGVHVDLHSKFGEAANQLSNQGTYILDNAITILSETANLFLNLILALIISVYLVSDGGRLVRGAANLVPADHREQVWFFITSLDGVLGGYIRGQLVLSALAGVLGGGGAAVLGVPYPLLIGLMTFILEMIPVIGPMVAVFPAVIISLFFNSPIITLLTLAWFIVFQQVVTNVLGPRIMGIAVGIHPLEALLAVLIGYPLGGLLGAFLAVPIMGIIHILVREVYAYLVLGRALPTAPVPVVPGEKPAESPATAESRAAAPVKR